MADSLQQQNQCSLRKTLTDLKFSLSISLCTGRETYCEKYEGLKRIKCTDKNIQINCNGSCSTLPLRKVYGNFKVKSIFNLKSSGIKC